MEELVSQLGIDWRLLIAQVVNFVILLWVLKRFAFGPLQAFLDKRRQEIKKGLDDAQEVAKQRQELKVLRQEIEARAKKDAEEILHEARKKGSKEYEDLMARAEIKVKELGEKTKQEIQRERETAVSEAKRELSALVVTATQKVLGRKVDEKTDKELISKALEEIT